MKKICMIVPTHYSARPGGAQYQAQLIMDHLVSTRRYKLYFISSRVGDDLSVKGYELIQVKRYSAFKRIGYVADVFALYSILKKIKPDVIYQRVGCAYTGVAAYYARNNNCKMVWHVAHEMDLMPLKRKRSIGYPIRFLEKMVVNYGVMHSDKIIAQTAFQNKLLKDNFNKCATVIPNFHPYPKEDINKGEGIKVVWVANLKEWKQPDVFVCLAREFLSREDVEFVMVGASMFNGGEYADLQEAISKTPNLRYLGALSQNEVNKLIAESHIFVNTSLFEGFPNTFIQAWMREVPVLSLWVNPDDIFSQTPSVGYCADGSYERMVLYLRRLLECESLRRKIGDNARRYAFSKHSENNVLEIADMIYEC